MLSRSILKAWIVCWFESANFWLPFLVGTTQQKEDERK